MLASPHTLIEGVIISSYAIRATHAFIYVRGEVLHVVRRLQRAVQEAYLAGHVGTNIHGSGYDLELVVHAGAGAYICGEETALLDSLEGRRGQPRLRPPFPAVAGLYACPTVINNVESIASVPSIVQNGADWFSGMGTEKSKGYGLFSLSGHVTRPGQYEAPLGITLRAAARPGRRYPRGTRAEVLDARWLVDADPDRRAPRRAARLRVRRSRRVDARDAGPADLRRDDLRRARRSAVDRVLQARVLRQVHAVPRGHLVAGPDPRAARARQGSTRPTSRSLVDLCDNILGRSFCALGDGATSPITSSIQYFRDEYLEHLTHGGCPFDPAGRRCSPRPSPPRFDKLRTTPQERPHDDRPTTLGPNRTGQDGHADDRRRRGDRSRGDVGDPRCGADRRPDPALLRPPAARAGRCVPPVPGRHSRRRQRASDPQAAGVLHDHGGARAWSCARSTRRRSPTRPSRA